MPRYKRAEGLSIPNNSEEGLKSLEVLQRVSSEKDRERKLATMSKQMRAYIDLVGVDEFERRARAEAEKARTASREAVPGYVPLINKEIVDGLAAHSKEAKTIEQNRHRIIYDPAGRVSEVTVEDSSGKLIEKRLYDYNDQGNVSTYNRTVFSETPLGSTYENRFVEQSIYDSSGFLIEQHGRQAMRTASGGEFLNNGMHKRLYLKAGDGRTSSDALSQLGREYSYIAIVNEQGKTIVEYGDKDSVDQPADGVFDSMKTRTEYRYDTKGRELDKKSYDGNDMTSEHSKEYTDRPDGSYTVTDTWRSRTQDGSWKSRIYSTREMNAQGKTIASVEGNGLVMKRYIYDDLGNQIREEQRVLPGKKEFDLKHPGWHYVERSFDEKGSMTSELKSEVRERY